MGTETLLAGFDPQTGVSSKDVTIIPETDVYARLYLPTKLTENSKNHKLPVLVYYHGGGFCLFTASSQTDHNYLNKLVAEAGVVAVSVNYRRPPENPLPTAFEDTWAALQWVASHRNGDGPEPWLNEHGDFGRLFMSGISAGATIAHDLAMMAGNAGSQLGAEILGVGLVHPYFLGSDSIGSQGVHRESMTQVNKSDWDRLWAFVCPSSPENDNPRINPMAEGAPSLVGLGCRRVLVSVAEKDLLRDRGRMYYEALGRSGWMSVAEIHETEGEDHGFHFYNLDAEKAKDLIRRLAAFFNS
ncbi:hypothetical protein RJ639_027662 [Escallonia herrerae]|uniref:Alpha/beta hydrolase fold-3 domain-containing protein n=1 Tax=Escallonia herrerae TaxID=1293975 RepID=A0AA88X9P5_9ASTE|nr:hypothetical protein RJ639_027662 [Escallonia herrerae]